jgi:H(+)-translocating pyrophosphatase
MLSEFTFFPSQALRRAMAKPMAWALLALFIAAAALPVADAASGSKGFLDTILKSGGERDASILIYVCCGIGVLFSIYLWVRLSFIKVERPGPGADGAECIASEASFVQLKMCYETIQTGAKAFFKAEYIVCVGFIILFDVVIVILTSRFPNLGDDSATKPYLWKWQVGCLTLAAFIVGAFTSLAAGYLGMMVAVMANAKCAVAALRPGAPGWTDCFNVAFRAGAIMGFSNTGIAITVLYGLCQIFRDVFTTVEFGKRYIDYTLVFECVSGFGLGGSCIALFGRVGGGIFTKAADVGADLSGKVIGLGDGKMLDEDSPYNPAVIADNVGNNVGDVAGMGSDLFGSLGDASCAAMLLGSAIPQIVETGWAALVYPLYISAIGIVVCLVVHFLATDIMHVKKEEDIETVLKIQLFMTALVMTCVMYPVTVGFLPDTMAIVMEPRVVTSVNVYGCVLFGVWAGCIIGFITEYYTSHTYEPTREVAKSCEKCAANGIIYGVALGYLSSIIPVGLIAGAVFFCFKTTLRGGDWVAWHVVHASYVLEYRRLRPHRRQRQRRC